MTKAELIDNIKTSLQDKFMDISKLSDDIDIYFRTWFKENCDRGMQILMPSPASAEGAPSTGGGGEGSDGRTLSPQQAGAANEAAG